MNSNKKLPAARGIPKPGNRQPGHAPQYKPVVAQLKTAVSAHGVKSPVAPPVYRPQPVPKVLQTKLAQPSARPVQPKTRPAAPPVYRPQPLQNCAQRKIAMRLPTHSMAKFGGRNTIQRAEDKGLAKLMEFAEPGEDNPMVVFCEATLNGIKLGRAWSRQSSFLKDGASEHAEDVIIDYVEWLESLNDLPAVAARESKATLALAASLKVKKELVINGLTATPCCSTPMGDAKVATASKKDDEPGCTEKLIDLANAGYSIKIFAKHYYRGKVAGGRSASVAAVAEMKKQGITVLVAEKA